MKAKPVANHENTRPIFDGERYVGEELSKLIAHGFQIYHDVPFDNFNIDHALVGKSGIFIVETKTRRKPVNKDGDKEYHVIFDGKSLQWPWGAEGKDIQQTISSAETFSKWLSKAVGERIEVSAILTLPGWWIDLAAPRRDLYVLNPKQIIGVCSSKTGHIDEMLIRRICHQLDQKCQLKMAS